MKGNKSVIKYLNKLLSYELAARDQYFIHSEMYTDWGYQKLYERINHEMQDETQHAALLIKRILFLEGTPVMIPQALDIGKNVPEMLKSDLKMEMLNIKSLKAVMAHCESVQDYQTREILQQLLTDTEEDHTLWLEQQLNLIESVGLKNYLQSQM